MDSALDIIKALRDGDKLCRRTMNQIPFSCKEDVATDKDLTDISS